MTWHVFINSTLSPGSGGWGKCAWSPMWMCGNGLVGAKVGIVGLGSIGLAVAKRLVPFEIDKILYCGRNVKPEGLLTLNNYFKVTQFNFHVYPH